MAGRPTVPPDPRGSGPQGATTDTNSGERLVDVSPVSHTAPTYTTHTNTHTCTRGGSSALINTHTHIAHNTPAHGNAPAMCMVYLLNDVFINVIWQPPGGYK